ncbi:unnamed protein product, partial [Rhizoctonia solani]
SSGHLSSPSILPTTSIVSKAILPRGKRNASSEPSPQTKRRRIDTENPASANIPKNVLANLGLAVGTNALTPAKLKSVAGLLAPSTNASRSTSRASKVKKSSATTHPNPIPVTSGTGTATDPVIISDEPPNQSSAKRATRSQEAHILLDALPDDPSDVLTQTLRTILKNPTTVPRGRSTVCRDTAIYLANGRLTGTPFLRLLRHLASPARRTNPALGPTLLKKLVEAMRATESAISKPAPAGPSSTASTPMPVTPGTPSTASFAPQGGSSVPYASEKSFEPSLFSDVDFATMELDALSLPTIPEADPIAPADIAIDPELLALSNNPEFMPNPSMSHSLGAFDVDLAELFGALPSEADGAIPTEVPMMVPEPLPTDPSIDWEALAGLRFEDLLATWTPEEQNLPAASLPQTSAHNFPLPLPVAPLPVAQLPVAPIISVPDQKAKEQTSSSGTMRIPPRAEALALLEQARARKKELEGKLLAARRQLWGCKIEAGVERNILEALKRA